jgi:hypothetical protein
VEVDVTISQKDWQRIKDAGLYDMTLFEYPSPQGDGEKRIFYVRFLRNKGYAGFYDLFSAENAKEELLKALHNLKAAIEVQKEGTRVTEFEI